VLPGEGQRIVTRTRPGIATTVALVGLLGAGTALPVRTRAVQEGGPVRTEARSVMIPLTDDEGWQRLRYSLIPPNAVDFSARGMRVQVSSSAAPLVYPLSAPMAVARLTVRGRVDGGIRIEGQRQGEKGFDDYVLRAGLVLTGSRRLGTFRRLFAPEWVRRLYGLAPQGQGISIVRFFNVGIDPGQIGQHRVHPLRDLLEEEVVAVPRADGTFALDVPLIPPAETIAVWLSSDGDDTGSAFTVLVEHIMLSAPAVP